MGTVGFEPTRISPRERPSRLPFRHITHNYYWQAPKDSNPDLTLLESVVLPLHQGPIEHRRLVAVFLHVSETLVRQFSPFINKALPILIQGFGASLALISFLTVDDSHTKLPRLVALLKLYYVIPR